MHGMFHWHMRGMFCWHMRRISADLCVRVLLTYASEFHCWYIRIPSVYICECNERYIHANDRLESALNMLLNYRGECLWYAPTSIVKNICNWPEPNAHSWSELDTRTWHIYFSPQWGGWRFDSHVLYIEYYPMLLLYLWAPEDCVDCPELVEGWCEVEAASALTSAVRYISDALYTII